jgi:p-aminobenzoyl-glutamate transporter AbgT
LDDAALAGLAAATSGHPLAGRVAQVHEAISDFEFDLALQQLDAVLAAIDEPAQEIIE